MIHARLIQGSANALPLEDESVQTCVTSPPYWGLRSYAGEQETDWADGTRCPLGLEPTPELYVAHMVEAFREVRRVLRPDGTLWLNLGDSYAASGMGGNPAESKYRKQATNVGSLIHGRKPSPHLKPKDLVGIPWMVAFALRADGWYLRSDIIWHKPNPMPESVRDRPTKSHEYIFLLTKGERYYYDHVAIMEPVAASSIARVSQNGGNPTFAAGRDRTEAAGRGRQTLRADQLVNLHGRNKRSVWTVATRPYSGEHFATYPPDLIEPCILAGSSPQACGVCGTPWARCVEIKRGERDDAGRTHSTTEQRLGRTPVPERGWESTRQTTGWRPTCKHDDGSGLSTVLDPFNGSGTTGLVAVRHGRNYVGVDISDEYLDLARQRINGVQMEWATEG